MRSSVAAAALTVCCFCCAGCADTSLTSVREAAASVSPWIVDVRRELHAIPELLYNESDTSSAVRRHLDALSIPYKYPYALHGIVATLGSGKPVIALRADMDALPITEPDGLPYKSRNAGVMHACGHDAHMAMLLGGARLLKDREAELRGVGTVKIVFQPAEEGGAGAAKMLSEGALDGVDAAFGMHVMPSLPTGDLAGKPGTIMAAADLFDARIIGRGGHAAKPHLNVDAVLAASAIVMALQALTSRETDPLGSAVISVTKLQGADANNVMPDVVTLGGTVRALTTPQMMQLKKRMQEVFEYQARTYGCTAELTFREPGLKPFYPATVNDAGMHAFGKQVATRLVGDASYDVGAQMTGEDFSFITEAMPAAYFHLGIGNETVGSTAELHTPTFKMDETALHVGAAFYASLALEYLSQFGGKSAEARSEL